MFPLGSDHSVITVRDDDILYITTKQIKEDILNSLYNKYPAAHAGERTLVQNDAARWF